MESFRIPIEGSSQWLLVFLDTVFFCLSGFKKEKTKHILADGKKNILNVLLIIYSECHSWKWQLWKHVTQWACPPRPVSRESAWWPGGPLHLLHTNRSFSWFSNWEKKYNYLTIIPKVVWDKEACMHTHTHIRDMLMSLASSSKYRWFSLYFFQCF